MRFVKELLDGRGVLLAGIVGGLAWAVGVPVELAAGVGAAVLGLKAGIGSLMGRSRDGSTLRVRSNSEEDRWLRRAQRAVRRFEGLSSSVRPGPVAEKCAGIGLEATTTLQSLGRLAGQVSAVGSALEQINADALAREGVRIAGELKHTQNAEVTSELERSLESVQEQLDVHKRLRQAQSTLLARMESSTIGLEGLVARLAEILALTETAHPPIQDLQEIDELSDELEGLRLGLAETETLSQRVLSAVQAQDSLPRSKPEGRTK
jgi:hypothetical protein